MNRKSMRTLLTSSFALILSGTLALSASAQILGSSRTGSRVETGRDQKPAVEEFDDFGGGWEDEGAIPGSGAGDAYGNAGLDLTRDPEILRAAEAGDPMAQATLGYLFVGGEGGRIDYQQALTWYRRAALQGHVQSMVDVGVMYVNGEGVRPDPVEGLAWYLLASSKGEQTGRRYAGEVAASLAPDQVEKARARAAELERRIGPDRASQNVLPVGSQGGRLNHGGFDPRNGPPDNGGGFESRGGPPDGGGFDPRNGSPNNGGGFDPRMGNPNGAGFDPRSGQPGRSGGRPIGY